MNPIATITRNGNTARVYSHPNPTNPRENTNIATLIIDREAAPNQGFQPLETSHIVGYELPGYALTLVTNKDPRPVLAWEIERKYGTYFLTGNVRHPNEINIAEAIKSALEETMPFYLIRFDSDGQLKTTETIHYADGIMFVEPKKAREKAPAWCDTPESLNNYSWAVLNNEYEMLRQYYAGEIYTFTVNDEADIDTREDLPEYTAFESVDDFIQDVVNPHLGSMNHPTQQPTTITTASGKQVSGIPNVFLNEYRNRAEVFLDDAFVSTYYGCTDREEAINMMLEDYGIAN